MPPPHGRCLRLLAALLLTGYIRRPCNFRCWIGRGLVPQCRGRWTARAVKVNYDLDVEKSKAAPGAARKQTWEWKGNSLDDAAFDQERLMEYIQTRPWEIFKRLASTLWIAGGIWLAWRERTEETPAPTLTTSLARTAPKTARGEALRQGLQKMGVFFVKVGQTAAQRPDIVGDEVAEELKGLQEQSTPFSDDVALRILAEDLRHDGPLAPGVLTPNCHADGPPLLKELNPKFVASASLGQVYRGLMHDGREVALKIQRPGVRDVLGLDWAVATLVSRAYQTVVGSPNDYGQVVDTVAKGVRMELDYYNEAANAEEFAMRHAFLPFVTSPGWIPELMGPPESSRVLALNWYPSRAPKELAIEERRLLVEMAVEACVVQLLVTGFVHADPHEGNLRLGDDGRVVFLDFGLMDRVDFGLMESCAAGVRQVLNKDWLDLTHTFQAVRFTPEPMMKNVDFGIAKTPRYEPCGNEEFAVAFQKQLESEEDGQSRFGAMAVALKKLSDRYLMLTPPFIALLCRTFITLEGLLADDPKMSEEYNVYETSLPFAICRLLSPRTRKGGKDLRSAFLKDENNSSEVNWSSLSALLMAGSDGVDSSTSEDKVCGFDLGTAAAVQRRLLLTAEGIALRRLCYQVDAFQACRGFLISKDAAPLREVAIGSLAEAWASQRRRGAGSGSPNSFGPRATAAARGWCKWRPSEPVRLPSSMQDHARRAWRIVARRQVRSSLWPFWRFPVRTVLLLVQVLPASALLLVRAHLRARHLKQKQKLR